ncbi:MAG: hypothetical protein VX460_02345, partial [Planctomycetota bacterium]|nr:hypothetical protein [Planctomycetota bacterium]
LWRERASSADAVDVAELGLAYASALSRRGPAEAAAAVLALVGALRPLGAHQRSAPVRRAPLARVSRSAAKARSGS